MSQQHPYDPSSDDLVEGNPLIESGEAFSDVSDSLDNDGEFLQQGRISYRGATSDPFFGFMIAIALSIGLTPLLSDNVDLRYTLAWGALAGVSVLSWLLGSAERIDQEKPENIAWGLIFGVLMGVPSLLFLRDILTPTTQRIFLDMSPGTLLAFLVFVMPISETLFFRGLLQGQLVFWVVGLLATLWNLVLFFPVMWDQVVTLPAVSVAIAIIFLMMNMIYVYVRERNGLAAAWICQILANLIMLFIPFL